MRHDTPRNYYQLDGQRFLRERWAEFKTGVEPTVGERVPDLGFLQRSERSKEFDQLCINRKILGAMRYGLLGVEGKPKWDRVRALKAKLQLYIETCNKECLVDIANYAEIEFIEGDGHFQATDDIHHCLPGGCNESKHGQAADCKNS